MDRSRQPGIVIHQVYLESARFGHRSDFLSLPAQPAPGELDVEMQAQYMMSEDGQSAVVRLTVHTVQESSGHYNFEVVIGALVGVQEDAQNMPLLAYARTAAPALLYPFAREIVANLTGRGRFGPTWLHPFNFVAALGNPEAEDDTPPESRPAGSEPHEVRYGRTKTPSTRPRRSR